MSEDSIRSQLERGIAAWNSHDVEAVLALTGEDASVHDIAVPEPARGREALQANVETYFEAFPDLHVDVVRTLISGDVSVQEWKSTGTHEGNLMGMEPTGKTVNVIGVNVADHNEDGSVKSMVRYWNVAAMLAQLGANPQPAVS